VAAQNSRTDFGSETKLSDTKNQNTTHDSKKNHDPLAGSSHSPSADSGMNVGSYTHRTQSAGSKHSASKRHGTKSDPAVDSLSKKPDEPRLKSRCVRVCVCV
jgi:hypothetical protein